MTGTSEGNEPAFTNKLVPWIDLWFNLAGFQEKETSIHLVKDINLTQSPEIGQTDLHLHTVFIIKLTFCPHGRKCECGKCHFNYTAFITLRAITAECKGSQSAHIKATSVICLENNDRSSSSNFKMLFYWLVRPRSQLQSLCSISSNLSKYNVRKEKLTKIN